MRWRCEKLTARAEGNSDLEAERRKLVIAQRHHAEIENTKLMAELLPFEDVSRLFDHLDGIFTASLDDLLPRLAQRATSIGDPALVQRVIDEETRAARIAAAEAVRAWAAEYDDAAARPTTKSRRRRLNGG